MSKKINGKINGIDISYCQRKINYGELKENGIDFVIIRSGYLEKTDDMLYTHLNGCKKENVPVGIYVYAMAKNVTEAVKEARHCIKSISGREILYPVFYDIEDDRLISGTNSEQRTDNAIAFLEEIKKCGYYPGIYLNPAWLENYLNKERLIGHYDIWLAAWTDNPIYNTKYNYGQTMWQWGLNEISGTGKVDGNICYKDYPSFIKENKLNISAVTLPQIKETSAGADFKEKTKRYRCIGSAVKLRKYTSDHCLIIKTLKKGTVYSISDEVYIGGKLKWLALEDGFSMYEDQIGSILFEEVGDE